MIWGCNLIKLEPWYLYNLPFWALFVQWRHMWIASYLESEKSFSMDLNQCNLFLLQLLDWIQKLSGWITISRKIWYNIKSYIGPIVLHITVDWILKYLGLISISRKICCPSVRLFVCSFVRQNHLWAWFRLKVPSALYGS